MKKIECVLLVDDSKSTNFYHKKLIEVSGEVNQIHQVENGLEALEYMCKKGKFNADFPKPNVIFLDINMPVMNGFEFLENFAKLDTINKQGIMIVFLTTSNWSKDKDRAKQTNLIQDFIEKPLTKEALKKVNKYYCENYLVA